MVEYIRGKHRNGGSENKKGLNSSNCHAEKKRETSWKVILPWPATSTNLFLFLPFFSRLYGQSTFKRLKTCMGHRSPSQPFWYLECGIGGASLPLKSSIRTKPRCVYFLRTACPDVHVTYIYLFLKRHSMGHSFPGPNKLSPMAAFCMHPVSRLEKTQDLIVFACVKTTSPLSVLFSVLHSRSRPSAPEAPYRAFVRFHKVARFVCG